VPALFLKQANDGAEFSPEVAVDLAATRQNTPAKALVFKLQAAIREGWVVVRNERNLIEIVKTYPDGSSKRRIYEVR